VLEKYPKDVKLVHKFLPHSREFSRQAAIAALAADDQGKFWEFHDKLFENQSVLNEEKVNEIAGMLKMDVNRFRKKMQDPAIEELIDRDLNDARDLDIRGTPQVYINGAVFKERTLPAFSDAIEKELKIQKGESRKQ
jgi:protein-disulfide isomerase